MRFFIEISYQGVNYHGWQAQPNAISVQSEINKALSTILQQKIFVMGAGRTDSGVHAKQMFAHFDYDVEFDIKNIVFKLNNFLPYDIVIHDIFMVRNDANCRFDAYSRTYKYHIIQQKNAFNKRAYLFKQNLDLNSMNLAADYILGEQDFTSFSKVNTQTFTNNCNVMFANWKKVDNELIFTIKSNRFLRNMVRAIVGTLIDVGIGKNDPSMIRKIIAAKDRSNSGASVPAHGLFLYKIEYPENIKI